MRSTVIILACLALAACGASTANNATNSNSRNANSSSSQSTASSTPADTLRGRNLQPVTMSIGEFMIGYDEENEGRIVTIEGGQLEEISDGSLLIRDGGGYGFKCSGSFSEYMEMKTRIDDMRYKHRSPVVTVKGVYAEGTSGKPSLNSCVLTDIKK